MTGENDGVGLSLGKRRFVGLISGLLAVVLVLVLLNLATRHNATQAPEALPLTELQELIDEEWTGLTGLIDVAEVVHSGSQAKVFDEDERIALRTEIGRTEEFLETLDSTTSPSKSVGAGSEGDEGLRTEALTKLHALKERTGELFDAVQGVDRAQTMWEEAQPK